MKDGKAEAQVPAEYLKAALEEDLRGGQYILMLMNRCWLTKTTPYSWHLSEVIPVYKKGSPLDCGNYRPISLVSVVYKVYAIILLNRLKEAGAEDQLWNRQFGFRSGRSTEDALFIVRKRVEQAFSARQGQTLLLALDWRQAFDCIMPDRVILALKRFGLNESMLEAIQNIYSERRFVVRDGGGVSQQRRQEAGIVQGCPLSPFLFGMLMSVLMADACEDLSEEAKAVRNTGKSEDAVSADDTLLISSSGAHLEELMTAVVNRGAQYGLQIHWDKVVLVPVRAQQAVHRPDGTQNATARERVNGLFGIDNPR